MLSAKPSAKPSAQLSAKPSAEPSEQPSASQPSEPRQATHRGERLTMSPALLEAVEKALRKVIAEIDNSDNIYIYIYIDYKKYIM